MISVCIATYNGEKYIKEQLLSILSQIAPNDEVIISDDGSTDNTLQIINELCDSRIRIIEGPHRHSPTYNFEYALKEAKGEYVFLADQDDIWKEDKVKTCLRWLQSFDCVISDAEVTDEKLRTISSSLYRMLNIRKGKVYNLICKNGYTGCCMAFKQKVKDTVLPFPKDIAMHDIWIGNVAAYRYKVKFIDEKLIYFRRHTSANSCNGKESKYSLLQRIAFRWSTIKNLIKLSKRKNINNNEHRIHHRRLF